MREFIYKVAKRFLTWVGDLMVATEPPKTKAEQILQMTYIIEPGDIICRQYNYYLDSYLIPGSYSHSGIVLSKDEIVHSIAEGVQFVHPIDFVKDTDGFIIVRPDYPTLGFRTKAIEKAIFHVNNKAQYDFLFDDPDKFYCHELTCDCLAEGDVIVTPSTFKMGFFPIRFQKTAYLASDIIKVCKEVYKF